MTIRSQAETAAITNLDGIKQTEPVLDERLNEIHGMVDNPVGSLHRTQGKVSCILGVTSSVWAIQQLRFREGAFVLRHDGPNLNAESWRRYRPGAVPFIEWEPLEDEDEVPPQPAGGFVFFPVDVLQDDEDLQEIIQEQEQQEDPRPQEFQNFKYNFNIDVDPNPMQIDTDEGETSVDFVVGLWPLAGFGNVVFTWDSDYDWFSIVNVWAYGTLPVENGVSASYGFFDDGAFDTNEDFRVVVDPDEVPAGGVNVSVTVKATNASGGIISTDSGEVSKTFTVQVVAAAMPAITLTPTSDTLFGFSATDDTKESVVNVKNSGGEGSVLNWTVNITGDSELTDILSLDKESGSLAQDADEDVTITTNIPNDIADGTYTATLTFTDSVYGTVSDAYTLTLNIMPIYDGAISVKIYQVGDPPFSTTTSGPASVSKTLPNVEYDPYYSWGYVGFFGFRGGFQLAEKRWYFKVVTSGATTESRHVVDGFDVATGCPVDFWTSGPGWGTLSREITLDTPT